MQKMIRFGLFGVISLVVILAIVWFILNQRVTTGNTISRTGEQIAFTVSPKGQGSNLFVLDLESGETLQLTQGENTFDAVWSPDGEHMALIYGDAQDLFILDVAAGSVEKVDSVEAKVNQVAWSPNEQLLAYNAGGRIIINNGDGSGERELVDQFTQSSFDWSPDGQKIIFVASDDSNENFSGSAIFVVNVDGSDPHVLISIEKIVKTPRWASDGSHILFVVENAHDQVGGVIEESLFIANADGSEVREVEILGRHNPPSWSPDGREIIYVNLDAYICSYHLETDEHECGALGFIPIWDQSGEQIAYIDLGSGKLCLSNETAVGNCFDNPATGAIDIVGWRPDISE